MTLFTCTASLYLLTCTAGFDQTVWTSTNDTILPATVEHMMELVGDEEGGPVANATVVPLPAPPAAAEVTNEAEVLDYHGGSSCIKPGPPPGNVLLSGHLIECTMYSAAYTMTRAADGFAVLATKRCVSDARSAQQ